MEGEAMTWGCVLQICGDADVAYVRDIDGAGGEWNATSNAVAEVEPARYATLLAWSQNAVVLVSSH